MRGIPFLLESFFVFLSPLPCRKRFDFLLLAFGRVVGVSVYEVEELTVQLMSPLEEAKSDVRCEPAKNTFKNSFAPSGKWCLC